MTARYRILMYERLTDRSGGAIDVPAALAAQVLSIAGISRASEPGETELADDQARALAGLLGFRANLPRFIYHLETLVTTQDRLRA